MHTHPQLRKQALLFRGLANERRLFMLTLLLRRPRTGVELVKFLKIRSTSVSKHLRILMTAGLVYGIRKKSSVKFYANAYFVREHFNIED